MKYIEELSSGDCFIIDNKPYLLTTDFKSNGSKLCFSLENGSPRWFKNGDIVEIMPVYNLDKENNIVPLKETKKDDYNFAKNTNIS